MSISIQKTATGHKHEAQRHADITNRKYRHADVNTNTSDIHESDAQRFGINSADTEYTQAHRLLTSTQHGAGIAQWLERRTLKLKGRGFESLLERRENFLLQGRLSVLTLISVSVPPPCYHSST